MISDFKGKTAVITGAGSGFGLACARIVASLGMRLVLIDVQQDSLPQWHLLPICTDKYRVVTRRSKCIAWGHDKCLVQA